MIGNSATTLVGTGPLLPRARFSPPQAAPANGAHDVPVAQQEPPVDAPRPPAALQRAVAHLNRVLAESSRELAFSIDQATGKTVVRVVEQGTGRVVRQIPSEEALVLAARLGSSGSIESLGLDTQA